MKIYRAVLQYNNSDTCEWKRWYTKSSVWYNSKELAEKHLPELNKYLDHLKKYFKQNIEMFNIEMFKYKGLSLRSRRSIPNP